MSGGPTQPKVVDELWSDERVRSFLELRPYDDTHADYHVLLKAYEHMIASDFQRFINEFKKSGRNINALDREGNTFLSRVKMHQRSAEYVAILQNAGAE
jgi:hypothetical protein